MIDKSFRSRLRVSNPRHAVWKAKYTSQMNMFRKQLSVGAFVVAPN